MDKHDKSAMQEQEERAASVQREEIFRGKTIAVFKDTYQFSSGRRASWDIVAHPGAVVIVPVTADHQLILVKQWRRAIQRTILEFPAGTLEVGEEPLLCAQRELREETGFQADQVIPMAQFYSAPGFCTELLHLFLAVGLNPAPLDSDEDEAIDLVTVSAAQCREMISNHQIQDAKTIAGFYFYEQWINNN